MREAAEKQAARARESGEAALRRVDLLRLRFEEGLEIHDIARRWGAEAWRLHKEYARARREFRQALTEVISFYHPGSPEEVEKACANLRLMLKES